jgi:hypothetical protein
MSNYVKSVDFASKDALTSGDPLKLIKGTEINTEFNNIQTAVATKADLASPAFTGNPTATTQATGNSSTRLATTAFVNNQINANASNVTITGGTINGVAITGGTLTGLATDLAVADGGTGKSTLALNNVLLGNGTSAIQEVAPSTSGNVLTSNGTTWVSQAIPQLGFASETSASNSTTITLGAGTWFVSAWYRYYDDDFPAISLVIDGVTVDSVPNLGDPTGTSYIVLFGGTQLSGGRTITVSATSAGTASSRRIFVNAIKVG